MRPGWVPGMLLALLGAVAAGSPVAARDWAAGPAGVRGLILYDASPFFFARGGRNALGANAILLSPLTAASRGDFGYAVTDELRLRPRFGSPAQLRALVRAAHARGLRVLLDMAANHLSDQSPYFRDAE